MDDQAVAGIGHNNPLPYDAEAAAKLEGRVHELADAGGAWLDKGKVEDDEQAGKLNDFLTQARTCARDIEAARKEAKKPHDDAAKAVDVKFKTLAAPLEKLGLSLKSILTAFAAEKQRQLDEERRRQQEEARRKQEEADRLRREAEARNDVIAQAAAEEAAKAAEKEAKAAAKPARAQIASATGGGRTMATRTTYKAEVENMNRAFSFFRDHAEHGPKIRALFEQLAEAERRSRDGAKEIPGITFQEIRSVA
nr:hypothetical protein [Paracoccus saliphilus]